MDNFNRAVVEVLEREGYFSNSTNDPGGETYYGIARKFHPDVPWPPTKEQAIDIYRAEYWSKCQCDLLAYPFALAVFDSAVNQGVGAAIEMLQKAVGAEVDGRIGPQTVAKMKVVGHSTDALVSFLALRTQRYVSIRDTNSAEYAENNFGWFRRLFFVALAGANSGVDP